MKHTGIGLNTRCNLTSTDGIEKGNVLTQDSFQVSLTKTLGTCFARVYPCHHVDPCTYEHAQSFPTHKVRIFSQNVGRKRTDVNQIRRIQRCRGSEVRRSDAQVRLCLWRGVLAYGRNGLLKCDEVLDESAENETHGGLQSTVS